MKCPKCKREMQRDWQVCPFCGLPQEKPAKSMPSPGEEIDVGGVRLAYIPPGEFMMGSPSEERHRYWDEGPVHRVRLTKGMCMAKYLVTRSLYKSVLGEELLPGEGGNLPMASVTWHSAMDFCKRLSKRAGVAFRLPTEAEWEYACRAGTTSRYYFGSDDAELKDYACFDPPPGRDGARTPGGFTRIPGHRTYPVAEKKPNAWGLYDMLGNAAEWCSDWYDSGYYASSPMNDPTGPACGSLRVVRGGMGHSGWTIPRCALRGQAAPDDTAEGCIGFRVCCDADAVP